jgi:hypothetical protein
MSVAIIADRGSACAVRPSIAAALSATPEAATLAAALLFREGVALAENGRPWIERQHLRVARSEDVV